jgi:hypothetical protein
MEEKHLVETVEIDENDWDKTPVSVKNLVLKLFGEIEKLKKHLKELQETNEKISEKVNQNSQNSNKITLEIVEEPDVITFETVLNGFKVSYGKQKLFFSDLNEFYQSLLTSAKELLFQLDQSQENLSNFPLLIKIYNFIEQSSTQQEQKSISAIAYL